MISETVRISTFMIMWLSEDGVLCSLIFPDNWMRQRNSAFLGPEAKS
jgi:hypothetical protein